MNIQATVEHAKTDVAIAAGLAAFSMFVIGYTATRLYLSTPSSTAAVHAASNEAVAGHDVLPTHPAAMWNALGQ